MADLIWNLHSITPGEVVSGYAGANVDISGASIQHTQEDPKFASKALITIKKRTIIVCKKFFSRRVSKNRV